VKERAYRPALDVLIHKTQIASPTMEPSKDLSGQ